MQGYGKPLTIGVKYLTQGSQYASGFDQVTSGVRDFHVKHNNIRLPQTTPATDCIKSTLTIASLQVIVQGHVHCTVGCASRIEKIILISLRNSHQKIKKQIPDVQAKHSQLCT